MYQFILVDLANMLKKKCPDGLRKQNLTLFYMQKMYLKWTEKGKRWKNEQKYTKQGQVRRNQGPGFWSQTRLNSGQN